ncbi:MAG: SAM-dependent methyltransferase [Gammaproteobacteria bacterium]|nr:SAM-dependent methyltransferase [Gammaproteobacteria bacterium]
MPATAPTREEKANVLLAESLRSLLGDAVRVEAETSGRADRKLPDILITHKRSGLRIVLEAKYDDFDAAVKAAQNRWDELTPRPDMVGAVSYSPPYKKNFENAVRNGAGIDFALSAEQHQDMHALQRGGEIYDLAHALRRPSAPLHIDDEVEHAVGRIQGVLADFVDGVLENRGQAMELARILQASFNGEKEKDVLEQTAKMAGLILFGAALFQLALSKEDARVSAPNAVLEEKGVAGLDAHWGYILDEINYAAIFRIARRILTQNIAVRLVAPLVSVAREVEHLAHDGVDLMGRIYHRLLADAKTLGAFYTTIPAATMMAGLVLSADDWNSTDWTDAESVGKFRVADPACGSGTLLTAAAWQLLDNFSRAHFRKHGGRFGGEKRADPRAHLCRLLLESCIWGYDILETATHLTAATLGMISPQTDFKKTHIYRVIIGEAESGTAAGSLDMLESETPIFQRDMQIESGERPEPLPPLDVCIMNPPFVRGTAGHEAFAFLPRKEQENVRTRMKELAQQYRFVTDKGQGAGFMALACLKRPHSAFIREGGKLAAILPATVAVGMSRAWAGVRAKIEEDFDLETLIVSREKGRVNFSEDTALQECILIARKRKPGEKPSKTALFVVLHKNPATVDTALAVVRAIQRAGKSKSVYGDLRLSEPEKGKTPKMTADAGYIGQYARLPWHGRSAWRGVSFAHMQLAFAAESFSQHGELRPYAKGKIALCKLGGIATLGGHTLDLKLNHPNFKRLGIAPHATPYAGYYPAYHKQKTGISHKDARQILEEPHCHLLPLPKHEDWMDEFYKSAGHIVLNQSFRFNTACRLAAVVSEPVQASHYWPISLRNESKVKLKTMALWLNSTPALLLIANAAQSTHGAKVSFSQKAALELPVLDVPSLSAAQLKKVARVFDQIAAGDGLLPLPQMEHDEERKKIDDVFSEILGLGDLAALRAALASEPIISGRDVIAT